MIDPFGTTTTTRRTDDFRFRRLDLPIEYPLRLFLLEVLTPGQCLPRHRFSTDSIPTGIICDNIYYSAERNCWSCLLYHPSWDEVPLGDVIPQLDEQVHIEVIVIGDDPKKQCHSLGVADSWWDLPSLLGG